MIEFGDLSELREDVDAADDVIIEELAWRFVLTDEIGVAKFYDDASVVDLARKEAMIEARVATGEAHGLDGEFVRKLYTLVHDESVRRQGLVQASLRAAHDPTGQV